MGRRAIWQLIFSGVFERYPNLRYTLAEQHGDWVPALLKEMDSAYLWKHGSAQLRKVLPMKPSEYFMANCFVVASFMSHEEAIFGVENNIVDRFLWGSDYPHPEGSFPLSELSLRKTLAGLDRSVVDAYMSTNALAAYRLDEKLLRAVADQIGPRYEDLGKPYLPDVVPDSIPASMAFRDYGHYA
jgi:predicted TIM-barrel fold metal-dependent hydrolase